jgi:hypothetical protein
MLGHFWQWRHQRKTKQSYLLHLDVIRYWSYTLGTRTISHYPTRDDNYKRLSPSLFTSLPLAQLSGGLDYILAPALFSSHLAEVHNPAEASTAVQAAVGVVVEEAGVAVVVLVGNIVEVVVGQAACHAGDAADMVVVAEVGMAVVVDSEVDATFAAADEHQDERIEAAERLVVDAVHPVANLEAAHRNQVWVVDAVNEVNIELVVVDGGRPGLGC